MPETAAASSIPNRYSASSSVRTKCCDDPSTWTVYIGHSSISGSWYSAASLRGVNARAAGPSSPGSTDRYAAPYLSAASCKPTWRPSIRFACHHRHGFCSGGADVMYPSTRNACRNTRTSSGR